MRDHSFTQRSLTIHRSGHMQRCFVVTWLKLSGSAAVSANVLCTPHNYAPVYSVTLLEATYIGCMCLAVTCHLHVWQNDRDLLHVAAATQRWNGYRNKSQHRQTKFSHRSCWDSNPRLFDHESVDLPQIYPRSPVLWDANLLDSFSQPERQKEKSAQKA